VKAQTLFIGMDGEKAVTSGETKKQIDCIEALECALQHGTEKFTWGQSRRAKNVVFIRVRLSSFIEC